MANSNSDSESNPEKIVVKKKKKYYCSFNDEWLKEDDFKDWLGKKNELEAECKICQQTLSVKYEGRSKRDASSLHPSTPPLWTKVNDQLNN